MTKLISLSELMGEKARAGEDVFPVTEAFFCAVSGRVKYLALRTGGVFNREEVLVSSEKFATGEGLDVALSAEEVEAAPLWSGGDDSGPALALEHWPSLITGPFGSTHSPLMVFAALASAAKGDEPAPQDRVDGDGRVFSLERASHRIGADVYGTDGVLGRLKDLALTSAWMVKDLVVERDGEEIDVDASHLRHWAEGAAHCVLNLSAADLEALDDDGDQDDL